MTRQSHDNFVYQDREFAILAFTGKGLFVPSAFGLEPKMIGTNCYRGCHCTYEVVNDVLLICALRIRLDEPKELLGAEPRFCPEKCCFVYERLPQPLPFSGGVLIGDRDSWWLGSFNVYGATPYSFPLRLF